MAGVGAAPGSALLYQPLQSSLWLKLQAQRQDKQLAFGLSGVISIRKASQQMIAKIVAVELFQQYYANNYIFISNGWRN
jgi:hypothetical protein